MEANLATSYAKQNKNKKIYGEQLEMPCQQMSIWFVAVLWLIQHVVSAKIMKKT